MASYKVLQDIEAEDKLLGPLTLRQFIYAGITVICIYLGFIAITKGATFLLIILLPIALLSGFFAFPWKLNQPTETWALAIVRYMVKPRRRIWNQSGMKELVTITAPETVSENYTNNLSQGEVKGRLKSLAQILDSRGWAIKNVNGNYGNLINANPSSDRLITISPTITEPDDSGDILDETSNPTAQRFNQMIDNSRRQRQNIMQSRKTIESSQTTGTTPIIKHNDSWFLNEATEARQLNPSSPILNPTQQIKSGPHSNPASYPVINNSATPISSRASVTQQLNPVILNFARNNDLNIATIARQMNKEQANNESGEVIVQLH